MFNLTLEGLDLKDFTLDLLMINDYGRREFELVSQANQPIMKLSVYELQKMLAVYTEFVTKVAHLQIKQLAILLDLRSKVMP